VTRRVYDKPYMNSQELIRYLMGKGLNVSDVSLAESVLRRINYYRFKIYLKPLYDCVSDRYRSGAEFTHGLALYSFDHDLRKYLFSAIARLEVKLRSRLDQVVSEHSNNPFWYLDDSLFRDQNQQSIDKVRANINYQFNSSNDDFVNHFRTKYLNTVNRQYEHLPPFWIAAELTTFGDIPKLYESLDKTKFSTGPRSNKLDELAKEFGASNLTVLNGWLKSLREVRNRCAHHSRIWNSNYREPRDVTRMIRIPPSRTNRIYHVLVMIHIMSKSIGLEICMRRELEELIQKYPIFTSHHRTTGMPIYWETDPIWQ